ncbi:MAG: cellulase, partial [Rubrivivax sp.]
MNPIKPLLGALLLAGASAQSAPPQDAPYRWREVAIVGGGFVDGFAFQAAVPGLAYARTDMGGAYRRDTATGRWQPLLDWLPLSEVNLMGVESLAVDPNDPNALYLVCGTYTNPAVSNGVLLRSKDRGKTFQRTPLPFKLGGNEGGRGNGERLAVDPNDGRVLFLASRTTGLWRSTDAGATLQHVDTFPNSAWQRNESDGAPPSWGGSDGKATINFLLFDPTSGTRGQPTRTVY